jgi:hypothetical protein
LDDLPGFPPEICCLKPTSRKNVHLQAQRLLRLRNHLRDIARSLILLMLILLAVDFQIKSNVPGVARLLKADEEQGLGLGNVLF